MFCENTRAVPVIVIMVVITYCTKIKDRPSSGVDLVYVFWTVQVLEPGLDEVDVTGSRGFLDKPVQDHLARIGFPPGAKALRVQLIRSGASPTSSVELFHELGRAHFNAALLRLYAPRAACWRDKTGFSEPRTHSGSARRAIASHNKRLSLVLLIHDIRGSNRGAPRQNVGAERDDDES